MKLPIVILAWTILLISVFILFVVGITKVNFLVILFVIIGSMFSLGVIAQSISPDDTDQNNKN